MSLVREGYETAFEEIVRRYNKTLDRYAAAIVPRHRAEDVTQDAFSKALLALRHSDAEIELRPWLFRIVRNTALNDLRDNPPAGQALTEASSAIGSALEEALRREDIADLMRRLRALPEPQRAAIVMRELEGLSHEEIAAALGITGGAARQAIYRARSALRDGVGMLIPLPVLKALLGGAAPVGAAGASLSGAGAGAAGGTGAGVALKTAAATLVVAGTVGTGVAIEERNGGGRDPEPAASGKQDPAAVGSGATAIGGAALALRHQESGAEGRRDPGNSGPGGGPGNELGSDGGGGGDGREEGSGSGPGDGGSGSDEGDGSSGEGSGSVGAEEVTGDRGESGSNRGPGSSDSGRSSGPSPNSGSGSSSSSTTLSIEPEDFGSGSSGSGDGSGASGSRTDGSSSGSGSGDPPAVDSD